MRRARLPSYETCLVYGLAIVLILAAVISILVFRWEWAKLNAELAAGLLTSAVLAGGLIAALGTLLTMKRNRMAEIVMRILELWNSGVVLEGRILRYKIVESKQLDFYETVKRYQRDWPELYLKLRSVPSLMEFSGWLARRHSISIGWVCDLLPVQEYYNDWEKLIIEAQEAQTIIKTGQPPSTDPQAYWGNFVWLATKAPKAKGKKK